MIRVVLIILFGFLIFSCSENETDNQLIGDWKLVKATQFGSNDNGEYELSTFDYSNENIIYSFLSNDLLVVEGGGNIGYPTGEYNYEFGYDCLGGCYTGNEQEILLVKINNGTKWVYNFENEVMRLGNSYVDGPDLFFERE